MKTNNVMLASRLLLIILTLCAGSLLGCAAIRRNQAKADESNRQYYQAQQQQREAEQERLKVECANIELMGIFTIDKRPMAPLIMYLAKIRNGTSMTRIVTVEWLDMYGQAMTSTNEIGAGQIVTTQLSANSPSDRSPQNLRITSCR